MFEPNYVCACVCIHSEQHGGAACKLPCLLAVVSVVVCVSRRETQQGLVRGIDNSETYSGPACTLDILAQTQHTYR